MKTSILIIVMLVVVLGTANAQQAVTRVYNEKTKIGLKTGVAVGYESRYGIELGGFYQEADLLDKVFNKNESSQSVKPRQYEKQFYGVYFGARITSSNWYDLKFNVRTGVTNGENFAITPSVLANVIATKNVQLTVGVGSRAFRPTLQTGISVKL